jgi:hypothetical protein
MCMYDFLQYKGDKIFEKTYLEEEVSFEPIPNSQQIVVQGSLCSSNWVDDKVKIKTKIWVIGILLVLLCSIMIFLFILYLDRLGWSVRRRIL